MKYPANVFSEKTEFFSRNVLKPVNKKKANISPLAILISAACSSFSVLQFLSQLRQHFFPFQNFRSKKTGLKHFSPVRYPLSNEELFFLPNAARADAGTQAEATTDFTFYNQSEDVIQRLMQGWKLSPTPSMLPEASHTNGCANSIARQKQQPKTRCPVPTLWWMI